MTSKRRSELGLLCAVGLAACGGSAAEAPVAAAGLAPGEVEHIGTLRYTPAPQTMSVAAYLGDNIRLESADAPTGHVLTPTQAVPEEALAAASGKNVVVRCIPRAPVAPRPDEAYPQGPDGQPMARPETCAVTSLNILPTP